MTSGTSQPRSFTSLTEVGSHCNVCVVFIHLRYCAKITNFCTFAFPKLKTSVTEERLWVFLDVFDDMKKVNIISLGCSKNLVDTEMLLKQLDQAGYDTETDVENSDAEVVLVNTCGYIGDAKEESVNTILEQVERKKEGIVEQVYVIGCL